MLEEMKEHFCAVGGFSFLLHGAVRFCAGYFKSKEMVCLAIFSYFLEVAQIGTLLQLNVKFCMWKKEESAFPLKSFLERGKEPFAFQDILKLRTLLGQGYGKQSRGGGGSPCDCLEFLTSLCLLCLRDTICSLCKHDVRIYIFSPKQSGCT